MKLKIEDVFFELANAYFKQTDLAFELPFANFDDDVIVDNDILFDKMFDAIIPVTFFENYLVNTDNEKIIESFLRCLYLSDQYHKLITFLEYKNIEELHSYFYCNAQTQKAIAEKDNDNVFYWQTQIEMKKNIETDTENIEYFDQIIDNCKEYLEKIKTAT
jgi:hypothetical protein